MATPSGGQTGVRGTSFILLISLLEGQGNPRGKIGILLLLCTSVFFKMKLCAWTSIYDDFYASCDDFLEKAGMDTIDLLWQKTTLV